MKYFSRTMIILLCIGLATLLGYRLTYIEGLVSFGLIIAVVSVCVWVSALLYVIFLWFKDERITKPFVSILFITFCSFIFSVIYGAVLAGQGKIEVRNGTLVEYSNIEFYSLGEKVASTSLKGGDVALIILNKRYPDGNLTMRIKIGDEERGIRVRDYWNGFGRVKVTIDERLLSNQGQLDE